MNRRHLLFSGLLISSVAVPLGARSQGEAYTRVPDVIYHRKHGVVLTLDVFKPAKPNGIGVLWMVSGGWVSNHASINPGFARAFLDRGMTVFQVVHGSQPKYAIPEIVEDIDRATRFVRTHAREYGVDPERLGIAGGSAGGHLSLMQGARGSDGKTDSKDPVEQAHSRVQAVACFYPPTDFLNYGTPGQNALTVDKLKPLRVAFGARSEDPTELERAARDDSPITYVTDKMPPTLIIHGDADTLVPIQQAELFMEKLKSVKVAHKLVVREGKGHGWPMIANDVPVLAEWFQQHLKGN
jgi:acetyl esterase/lipase